MRFPSILDLLMFTNCLSFLHLFPELIGSLESDATKKKKKKGRKRERRFAMPQRKNRGQFISLEHHRHHLITYTVKNHDLC